MSDDTPITDDERARVEARHAGDGVVTDPLAETIYAAIYRARADEAARLAVAAVRAYYRALVPEERAPERGTSSAEECHGWNACRAEMLKRLGVEEKRCGP